MDASRVLRQVHAGRLLSAGPGLLWLATALVPFLEPGLAAPASARPKVALVLGGGGARGVAHVGVLRWLEQNRVPVDMVIGTSMGGLIGGTFAMGWTPDEIQALIESLDWDELFSSTPPYTYLTYRRKEDSSDYTTRFELGWKKGPIAPARLNAGHFIGLLVDRLAIPYYDIPDFDALPTPFRCVATDLETGEQVVFSRGPLNLALRATMAIPGVFSAVEHEGRLLVDGGVLNNVPADLARRLGAEMVIAVDVGSPLRSREELGSLLGVVDQTLNILILENVRRSIRESDILLAPELEDHGTLDFRDLSSLIEKGFAAADARARLLRTLSVDDQTWEAWLQSRRSRIRTDVPGVGTVVVEGVGAGQARRVAEIAVPNPREPLRLVPLEEALTAVYGEGRTDAVGYQLSDRGNPPQLLLRVQEKGFGPPFLRFGLNIDGSELDDVGFVLRSRTTFFDFVRPGSETRVDLDLGSPLGLAGEFYLPAGGRWFVAASAFGRRRSSNLYVGDSQAAEYREATVGSRFDLGYGFGLRRDEVRLGWEVGRVDSKVRIGDPLFPALKGTLTSAHLRWVHNGLDSPTVPSRGLRWDLEARRYFETPREVSGYGQFLAQFAAFQPVRQRGRVFVRSEAATSFDRNLPPSLAFSLGGPLRLGSFGEGELRGSRLVFTSVGYLHELGDHPGILGSRTYVGGWYEGGSAWNRGDEVRWRHLGSAGFVLDSLLGPVFVGSSWGEGGRFRMYFSVGFIF
ncbi:MAG: patatin-like phospholipase family protein [Acidobacteriota bacterium]